MIKKLRYIGILGLMTVILLSGCSLPGLTGPAGHTVTIGTMGSAESKIMGYINKYMIKHYTDINVDIIPNLGSSVVQHKAMVSEEIDISATRYTGTDLVGTLGMDPVRDPEKAFKIVKREFKQRFNATWFKSYGFANSWGFFVTNKLAEKKHLDSVSDLEPLANEIRIAVPKGWIKRPGTGYQSFKKKYGFGFKRLVPMQLGLAYKSVAAGDIDAVLAYTTDGRLLAYNMSFLKDDKHLFPPFDSAPVIRNEVLNKYPELRDIFKKLDHIISTQGMRHMSYLVDVKLKDASVIARNFLEKHDYFENK